ncbi:membrane-associated protein, putative, partial [Bodo saltans]
MHDGTTAATHMSAALIVVVLLTCTTAAAMGTTTTPIQCQNNSVVISTSGQYDVSCNTTDHDDWVVYIVGCWRNRTVTEEDAAVNARLIHSPKQVVISDDASYLSMMRVLPSFVNASLMGCSVAVTFDSDTMVPLPKATLPQQAHVYISAASSMRSITVVMHATLHLEGCFIAVTGTSSIDSLVVLFSPTSSVQCRRAHNDTICNPATGTSIVRLNTTSSMMSIGSVYISFNRTNVTGSMWPREYRDGDNIAVYGSSFALIALEPAAAPPPGYHVVILTGVVGTVVSNGGLLVAWAPNDDVYGDVFSNYPNFNGTFFVKNCTLTTNPTPLLSLPSMRALRLVLDHVNTTGALIHIDSVSAPPTVVDSSRSAVDDNSGCECREEPRVAICIRICNSFISTPPFRFVLQITPPLVATRVPTASSSLATVIDFSAHSSNFALGTRGCLFIVDASPLIQTTNVSLVQLMFSLATSTVELGSNFARIFEAVTQSFDDGHYVDAAVLFQSTMNLRSLQVHQWWWYFDSDFTFTKSLIVMQHASYTTVSIDSSEFISFQNSTVPYPNQPPNLLLDVSGVFLESIVRISNTAVMSSLGNGNTAAHKPPTVMQLSTVQSSKVVVAHATFVNLHSLLRVRNLSSPPNSDVMASIDVCSRWCTTAASREPPLNCADFTQANILNSTVMPAWLDVVPFYRVCTHSLSEPFSRTITTTGRLSLSRPITTTERNHMTTSATRILTPTATIPLLS